MTILFVRVICAGPSRRFGAKCGCLDTVLQSRDGPGQVLCELVRPLEEIR